MTQTQPKSKTEIFCKKGLSSREIWFVCDWYVLMFAQKNEITITTTLTTIIITTITIKITINNNNNDDDKTSTRQGKRS